MQRKIYLPKSQPWWKKKETCNTVSMKLIVDWDNLISPHSKYWQYNWSSSRGNSLCLTIIDADDTRCTTELRFSYISYKKKLSTVWLLVIKWKILHSIFWEPANCSLTVNIEKLKIMDPLTWRKYENYRKINKFLTFQMPLK